MCLLTSSRLKSFSLEVFLVWNNVTTITVGIRSPKCLSIALSNFIWISLCSTSYSSSSFSLRKSKLEVSAWKGGSFRSLTCAEFETSHYPKLLILTRLQTIAICLIGSEGSVFQYSYMKRQLSDDIYNTVITVLTARFSTNETQGTAQAEMCLYYSFS